MYATLYFILLYAFFGWCMEVIYAAFETGHFVNRGFLNGPICPIYGFGTVLVLNCLNPLTDNLIPLFLVSMLLTSSLELVAGFTLEKIFCQRWWDYTDEPFNFSGYICLRFSIIWGVACVFVIRLLHPIVKFMIYMIPEKVGWGLLILFGFGIVVDIIATVCTITKLNQHLIQVHELAHKIREISDELGENLSDKVIEAAEYGVDLKEWLITQKDDIKLEHSQYKTQLLMELSDRKIKLQDALGIETFGQKRLLKAFPKMRSTRYGQPLESIRHQMKQHRSKK